jgi:ABC-type transport system involved in cytochrome c biogenesis permease component
MFNARLFEPAIFYKLMFANLGVKIWLTWIAAILALVSVASMFPDFISSGSIELSLSKPLGRARLFITKYLAGLLFVTLQVLVFTIAAYLVIGLRGKAWEEGLFWAVPLTVLCFSYIYAVCVLLGLLTRSTIASLLLTLILWFAIFGVHTTENTLLYFKVRRDLQAEKAAADVADIEAQRTAFEAKPKTDQSDAETTSTWTGADRLEQAKLRQAEAERSKKSISRWHGIFFATMTALPKTSETIEVLERRLVSDADLEDLRERDDRTPPPFPGEEIRVPEKRVQERLQDTLRSRSVAWVIGTSLAFEAFVLLIAGWIFCRREF